MSGSFVVRGPRAWQSARPTKPSFTWSHDLLAEGPRAPGADHRERRPLADRLVPWLRTLAARGAAVLVGDPGRAYLPKDGLLRIAEYAVPTSLDLEDRTIRDTVIWQLSGTLAI